MSPDSVLNRAIADIADGAPVDWNLLDAEAQSDGDREWAKALRILQDVANVHRAGADDLVEQTSLSVETKTAESPGVLADGTPHIWGRYRLDHKVGEGSFGRVYRAWDPELERDVAIKILHSQVADTHLKDRLLREGRALAKVRHPNVVNVLGVEAHENRVGLCMEFVRGETLANVVHRHGKMSARETVLIGEDLCRALSAVHLAGFIHRDVKARNVMREEAGRIVLMDFGTGRAADRPHSEGDFAGTPAYMAPEVLEGQTASARSDVYSLGVLLYHLVTAAYPVEGRSMDDVRDAHAQRRRQLLSERRPDLPVSFIRVVERAIASDPRERYANAGELLQALGTLHLARPPIGPVLRYALIAVGALCGMTALGTLTSTHFNIVLQRSGFASDTLGEWLLWGRRTSVPPFFILLMVLLAGTALAVVRRLCVAASARARRLDETIGRGFGMAAHRFRLDDVSVLASYALLLSASVLAGAWRYFSPLFLAFLTDVSTASGDDLKILSPAFVTYHNQYRGVFTVVVIFFVAVWYPVAKLVRKGQSPHWGLIAGGAVAMCAALASLHVPYRLLYFSVNEPFEAVSWNGAQCYSIGERVDDLLLFCPDLPAPRNRIVKRGDESLKPLGIRENIFSRFGKPTPDPGVGADH